MRTGMKRVVTSVIAPGNGFAEDSEKAPVPGFPI